MFLPAAWLFVLAIALHNLEEAVWLPAWSKAGGRLRRPVDAPSFRFAVLVLTFAAAGCVLLAAAQGPGSTGAYLLCGYALAMLVNVVVPHLAVSLATGTYAPGTGTAVLLNLPAGAWLLHRGFAEGWVSAGAFAIAGPLTALALAASIPLLLALGGWLLRRR
jgi:hypothetical protein